MTRSSNDPGAVEPLTIEADGGRFHALAAGRPDAPLVLLLHGFPECAEGWRRQMQPLAARGFRVVAPDQRGYGLSDKPLGAGAYRIDVLVHDVLAMADALGAATFSLVGHDWGGIVAWRLASDHPERVTSLAILNAPNLDVVLPHAMTHPSQLAKSSYVALFQLPWLPEMALSAMDYRLLVTALRQSSLAGTFDDDVIATYRRAWSQPGALTAMLNWYRALPTTPRRAPKRIAPRTLILWGDRDTALDAGLAEASLALCDDGRVHHFVDATHWIHHERADEVDRRLCDFLAPSAPA